MTQNSASLPSSAPPAGASVRRRPVIALVGNPNTGKTSLFNALCGARQRVGNYPGVTVEKKIGFLSLKQAGEVEVVDLPGLYSLKAISPDEEVAMDVVMGRIQIEAERRRPDLVLFVLDGTNLKRNLFLYSQVAELGLPVVAALTMADLLPQSKIDVNLDELSRRLDAPVAPVMGRAREQIDGLKSLLDQALATAGARDSRSNARAASPRLPLSFPTALETAAAELAAGLADVAPVSLFEARELLANPDHPHAKRIEALPGAAERIARARGAYRSAEPANPAAIAVARYRWADETVAAVERREAGTGRNFSHRIDQILTHRVFGFAAFAGVMYLVFRSIYAWAEPLMGLIEDGFAALGGAVGTFLVGAPILQSLIVDGVIAGVGSVVVFLPQIIILFLFVAFLEDSGYLARAAFMMDRLLGWTGLNGRAFIPMLSSFACAIPGIMATRVMPDAKARMATILVSPLMSCSARLPVYLLLIGAFIEPQFGPGIAALTLFLMHGVGLIVALPVAWILNRKVLKTPALPFLMELPPYRMPQAFDVVYRAYEAAKKFLIRAGTIIFALSIVIWALSYFPRPDDVADRIEAQYALQIEAAAAEAGEPGGDAAGAASPEADASTRVEELQAERDDALAAAYLEQSFLGRLGKTVQPVFAPLGFDWKISVGILGAFPAREVIISTLGIIYTSGADVDEESPDLRSRMAAERHEDGSPVYTPLVAVTLMVFFALCSQCMSTLATVQRELNSWKWAIFLFVYMTALAYLLGLAVYQGGQALGLG